MGRLSDFGSSDITVKHVWVVNPGFLRMNISVKASAAAVPTTISVASGLQLTTLNTSFQVTPSTGQLTLLTPDRESGHRSRRRPGRWSRGDQHLGLAIYGDELDPVGMDVDDLGPAGSVLIG